MKKVIDLRTDTSSSPTEEILEAMRHAKLGNDGFREDPTVNALESLTAKKFGKEDAMLVASGTQGNLVTLMSFERSGKGMVIEERSHIIMNEEDGYAKVAGLVPIFVKGHRGFMSPKDASEAMKRSRVEPAIMVLENTHTYAGGAILPISGTEELCRLGRERNLFIHLDGSRIFHASVGLGVEPRTLAEGADTIMFCLSKALCCPIGSVLLGSEDFIRRARTYRKLLGGQMRKAGVIAAAGILALEKMVDRLKEDHDNAKVLARGLSKIAGVKIEPDEFETNIVHFEVPGVKREDFVKALAKKGVMIHPMQGSSIVRAVTYRDIKREDIEYTLGAVDEILMKTKTVTIP